jgi:hypothetical protein
MQMKRAMSCAVAALVLAFAAEASAQRGGGGARGGAVTAPSIERPAGPSQDWRRVEPDVTSTRSRVRAACAADPTADFCSGGSTSSLRRRIWNACHGDNPPQACRRIFGDNDDGSHLRRRIWNACHSSDAPPDFCRRIFGRDPTDPHLRRRIWNACNNGDLSPAFCRRVFGEA